MKKLLQMEKEVFLIYQDCLAIGKNIEEQNGIRLGFSRGRYQTFNNQKLLQNAEAIYLLIQKLNLPSSYEELKKDKNGNYWTQLNYAVDLLVAMANALGWIESVKKDQNEEKEYTIYSI